MIYKFNLDDQVSTFIASSPGHSQLIFYVCEKNIEKSWEWLGYEATHLLIYTYVHVSMHIRTQVKLKSFFWGRAMSAVSDAECQAKLESLKQEMMKAFNYAQGECGCVMILPISPLFERCVLRESVRTKMYL